MPHVCVRPNVFFRACRLAISATSRRGAVLRYAEHDLSDGIGANRCPCALRAELQASFSWPHRMPDRHYHRGTLEASQSNFYLACGDRRPRQCSSRTTRYNAALDFAPGAFSRRNKTTKVPSCGPDPAIATRAANRRAVLPQKNWPRAGPKIEILFI